MAVRTQRFTGFPPGGFEFFLELQAHQSRDWFQTNKQRYETLWVRPLEALLEDLTGRLSDVFPEMPNARRHIFRIQRDIRFSADKSPYKTHIAGHVPVAPTTESEGHGWTPSLYTHFSLDWSGMSMGNWMVDKEVLLRFRERVAEDKTGALLQRTIERLEQDGFQLSQHETFKRVPAPYPQDHPRADLLKRKDLGMNVEIPEDHMARPDLLDWLDERMHKLSAIGVWLLDNLRPAASA